MSERDSSTRIGDAERSSALAALDRHMEAGRLPPEEYGLRSGQVTDSRTVGDLQRIFYDLPDPHPTLPGAVFPAAPSTSGAPPAPGQVDRSSMFDRRGGGLVAATTILALILFFVVPVDNAWLFFLLIPLVGILARNRESR